MYLSKSSSLHLYDSLNKDLYTTSTFSDRVEHNSGSKPQHFHGSSVKLYNNDGTNTYSDVVSDLDVLKAGQVSDRVYTNTSALTEATARVAVDVSLTALVNTATVDRTSTYYTLQNTVTTNKAAAVASVSSALVAHTSVDTDLKASIDAEKATFTTVSSSLRTDLTAEASRALAAEQKESVDCVTADASLQANLTAEAARSLTANSKEAVDYASADSSLISRINERINERVALVQVQRARIDAILADNSIDLNKLKNIVDAYSTLDTKQATEITGLTSTCALLQTQVTALKSKIDLALLTEIKQMGKK